MTLGCHTTTLDHSKKSNDFRLFEDITENNLGLSGKISDNDCGLFEDVVDNTLGYLKISRQ